MTLAAVFIITSNITFISRQKKTDVLFDSKWDIFLSFERILSNFASTKCPLASRVIGNDSDKSIYGKS